METVLRRTPADVAIHLGDGLRDFEEVRDRLGEDYEARMRFLSVPGNCDIGRIAAPAECRITLEGFRFLLLHGHTRGVKHGTEALEAYAAGEGIDVVLYGHTHRADDRYLTFPSGKALRLFNPGSIGAAATFSPSFGYLEIRNGQLLSNTALWEG